MIAAAASSATRLRGACGADPSDRPHLPQYTDPGGASVLQPGQTEAVTAAPHARQNAPAVAAPHD
jgi:hypothetical protein